MGRHFSATSRRKAGIRDAKRAVVQVFRRRLPFGRKGGFSPTGGPRNPYQHVVPLSDRGFLLMSRPA
jgi:hypothetical protein